MVFHSRSESLDDTFCGSTIIHYCPTSPRAIPVFTSAVPHHPLNTRNPTTTHPLRESGDSNRGPPLKVCRGRPRWRTWAWRRTCPGCPWWCYCCALETCSRSLRGTWSPSCVPRATSWSRSGAPSPRPWRPPSSLPGRTSERAVGLSPSSSSAKLWARVVFWGWGVCRFVVVVVGVFRV